MKEKKGRPMRYAALIFSLADDELWSNRSIGDYAVSSGQYPKEQRRLIVDALGNFERRLLEGVPPDGKVDFWDSWYGHRWKAAVPENQRP